MGPPGAGVFLRKAHVVAGVVREKDAAWDVAKSSCSASALPIMPASAVVSTSEYETRDAFGSSLGSGDPEVGRV